MKRNASWVAACAWVIGAGGIMANAGDWTQWGGAARDFKSDCKGLADKWPEDGPKKLWTREIGDGYSSVVVDGDTLYTMYRKQPSQEVVVAMNAADGKTRWEYAYDANYTAEMQMEFGPGPHCTPLIVEDRIYTAGVMGNLYCLNKKTGKPIWSHDFVTEYGTQPMGRGYASSPLAIGNVVIVPVGAKDKAIIAFDQMTGNEVWSALSYEISHSSPIAVIVDGEPQVLVFTGQEISGLNPKTGELLWTHPHPTQYGANIATPTWLGDNMIFVSSAYGGGSRVIKLTKKDGKIVPEELWANKKVQIHHGNAIADNGMIYASSGSFGPAFLAGIDAKTGDIKWRERGFAKATMVYGDGKLIFLDQDGQLVLAIPGKDSVEIRSKCQLMKNIAWTVPALVGKTLYLRDREKLMALDLGA